MKQLTWLHLSDWHQRGPDFDRGVVRDALIKDIRERKRIDPALAQVDFVVFSGDLAYSGKPAEYEAARQHLLDPLLDAVGLEHSRLFIVPGNHDLSRETVYEMLPTELLRPLNSDALVQRWLDAQKRARTLEPFEAYRRFVSDYTGQPTPDYASIVRPNVTGKRVALLGLNSAWMNGRNKDAEGEVNDYGYTLIGEPQLHEALAQIADAELRIAVVHHPFDWLNEFDRNHTEARLGRECHFILRGHVHNPQVHVIRGTAGDCVIIPAGASYKRRVAEDPRYTNAYNWVHLDFGAGEGAVYLRRWSDQRNEWIEDIDSHPDGKFVLDHLPKALGKKSTDVDVVPTAPLSFAPSRLERERIALESYLNALVRNNTDLDSGGIKQTKVQVVVPLDEIYVGLQADRDRPDVDHRVMQEELEEIKKRLEREEDPKERERQYQIWASQARTLQRALEISGPREDLANIVQRHRQVVLLGDPGSGKTTLVRYLTLRLARAILVEPERLSQPQELWDQKSVWRLPDLGPVRLPILLRISHYAEARQKDPDLALVNYLPRYFSGLSVPHADELGPLLHRLLDEGRCMVLLDGLDEIIDPTDRRNIAAAIGQFAGVFRETGLPDWLALSLAFAPARAEVKLGVHAESEDEEVDIISQWDKHVPEDVRQEWSKQIKKRRIGGRRQGRAVRLAWELLDEARYAHVGNRFVVTSRIAGYHFAGVPGEFEHYTISRMSLDDIKLFLDKWCPAVERRIAVAPDPAQVEQRARREIEGILQAVETTPGVRRMAENPLLLRILAIIHRNEAHLPQRRVELYETASVTLLRDWHLERGTKGAAIDDVKATSLLGPVAFYIHENRASGFLSKGETERILAGILARERGEKDPDQPSLETREAVHYFLETVREHSGLFVERGEGLYGFMHLTFEEYFTARQLVSSSTRARAQILERLHLPRWREPILLAVGSLSKQFYDDTQDLLRAILEAGSAYEGKLHRDLLFAAACVGDSVNVAPVLRQEIAGRLLALYCDRRGAGRFRLLQQQVKDALLTLCNDQGDSAVEAALAETLACCADRAALTCALDAVDWLKARTQAVARALAACPDLGALPRALDLLRRVQARLSVNGNGTRTAPTGWEAVREDPTLARLLGVMWLYGWRTALERGLQVPVEILREITVEAAGSGLRGIFQRLKNISRRLEERSAGRVPMLEATEEVGRLIDELRRRACEMDEPVLRDLRSELDTLTFRIDHGISSGDPHYLINRLLDRLNLDLSRDTEIGESCDKLPEQLQRWGSLIVRNARRGGLLVPLFIARSARLIPLPPPDEDALRANVSEIQTDLAHALLDTLRSPADPQRYIDAALFLTLTGEGQDAADAVIWDLDGADAARRRWALQALTERAIRESVQFTDARQALLLSLLDAPTDESAPALDILFALGFTPDLLAGCWSVLRRPDRPLADAVREQLDRVKEVKGDRPFLAVLDEGLRDDALRSSALELLRRVRWQGTDTFGQTLTWLSGEDTEVRHLAALLLAGSDDLLAIPRRILANAAIGRLQVTVARWAAQREDARLVRLLGGFWLHGWDDALTQLWVGQPAKSYVDRHPRKYWKDFRTYPETEDCIRWLLEKGAFGHALLPTFQAAAARLAELEVDEQGAPRAEHICTVQQEMIRQMDAVLAQPAISPLLRMEVSIFVTAVSKEALPPASPETLQAALGVSDNNDWYSALSRLATQRDQQPLVVSALTRALESADRERRLRALALLFDHETLREAMAEVLTTRFLNHGIDADEALSGLGLMLQLKRPPAGLYPWLRSLCTAETGHPLSAWISRTLGVYDLAPDSPPVALAPLLTTDAADIPEAASLALLAADLPALLVPILVEAAQSPDDRVRMKGEQRLYSVCDKFSSYSSTSAVDSLLRFKQDAGDCTDGYLGTVSTEAASRVEHTSFGLARWLEMMGEEGPGHKSARQGLNAVQRVSADALRLICAVLNDSARPLAARLAVAGMLGEILKVDPAKRTDASIHTVLVTGLGDPDPDLRRSAAYALRWMAGPGAWPVAQVLLRAAQTDPDIQTRILALRSLGPVLHTGRGFRDVDVSKEALFRWLEIQTKELSSFGYEDTEAVKQLPNLVGIKETPDAKTILASLSHPTTLGLPEDAAVRLQGSEKWDILVKGARQEWETRRYWLDTLPLLPAVIAEIEVLFSAPNPAIHRAAACALARLYHGDDDRLARLRKLLPDDPTLLRALLDAATDQDIWGDEGEKRVSHHPWAVKQIVGWVEAKPPVERARLISSMLDDLDEAMEGAKNEEDDKFTDPYIGWPTRRILTTVLAELSERLTYRTFTLTRDLPNVVALFIRTGSDPESYSTRRFAVRALGNLQQLTDQVADVFFAACQDVGAVYRETRTAETKFKAFGTGSLERLTAAIRSPSITVAYHAALLLGELGVSRSEDLGREGRQRVADELVQLLDDPLAERIVYDFTKGSDGKRVGPLYDEIYEALVRVVAGPDAPRSVAALEQQ